MKNSFETARILRSPSPAITSLTSGQAIIKPALGRSTGLISAILFGSSSWLRISILSAGTDPKAEVIATVFPNGKRMNVVPPELFPDAVTNETFLVIDAAPGAALTVFGAGLGVADSGDTPVTNYVSSENLTTAVNSLESKIDLVESDIESLDSTFITLNAQSSAEVINRASADALISTRLNALETIHAAHSKGNLTIGSTFAKLFSRSTANEKLGLAYHSAAEAAPHHWSWGSLTTNWSFRRFTADSGLKYFHIHAKGNMQKILSVTGSSPANLERLRYLPGFTFDVPATITDVDVLGCYISGTVQFKNGISGSYIDYGGTDTNTISKLYGTKLSYSAQNKVFKSKKIQYKRFLPSALIHSTTHSTGHFSYDGISVYNYTSGAQNRVSIVPFLGGALGVVLPTWRNSTPYRMGLTSPFISDRLKLITTFHYDILMYY